MDTLVLRERLGERFITDPALTEPYLADSSRSEVTGTALGVVLAESAEDVSIALAFANEHRIPVSVRGAGTGLVGGANVYDGGLIVSLERMNKVLEVSPADRLAVVQPGVITAELDALARTQGLFYPPDPASAETSSVGGNLATNAGGLRCVAHGVTSDWVLGLTVVLADGRIMRTGARTRKNVVGYDLTRLFVGSEGTLGVIVEAIVRLEAVPPGEPVTVWAEFADLTAAGAAVSAISASPVQPEVLELMDRLTVETIEQFNPTGVRVPDGALLVAQTVGEYAPQIAEAILNICREQGAVAAEVAETDALVEARRLANPALNARGLKLGCDVGVPVSQLATAFTGIDEISQKYGIEVSSVAHAGDGNLHCRVAPPETPGGHAQAELLLDDITRLALSLGGTITGEHGIGAVKRHELPWQLDPAAIEMQHAIKAAFDPHGILTPGRAI